MKDEKKAPRNTAAEVKGDASGFLGLAMLMGGSGAIERQEAQGQQSFVNSDTLPMEMSPADKQALENCGVKFLGPVPGDDLFQFVELPKGWTKQATDHSMWSELRDEKGRKRGGIFYKAAFYDRKAHLHLTTRYTVQFDYGRNDAAVSQVKDGEKAIFSSEPIPYSEGSPRWQTSDRADAIAKAWVSEHFPQWQDASAYWE